MKVTISVKRRWDAQDRAKINFRLFRILLLVRFFFIWRINILEVICIAKKKTHDEYIKEVLEKNPDVEVIGIYQNSSTKILHKCKICGNEWLQKPSHILAGHKCKKCMSANSGFMRRRSNDSFIRELKQINTNVLILNSYLDSNTKIKCKCKIDNYEWEALPHSLLNGHGCPMCANNAHYTPDEFANKIKKINSNVIILGEYKNATEKILCECKLCKNTWETSPNVLIKGCGCPKCGKHIRDTITYNNDLKLKGNNIICIDEFAGVEKRIKHKCLVCNYIFEATPQNVLKYKSCPICNIKVRTKSHESFKREISDNIELLTDYINAKSPIKCRCKLCGYEWSVNAAYSLKYSGCPKCAGNIKKNHIDFVKEVRSLNPNIEIISDYISSKEKITCQCVSCKNIWKTSPSNLLNGTGCPKCKSSIGEKKIADFLFENSITYIAQYKFSGLKGIGNKLLSYDFYISNYNLLIEFQGKQHFESIEYFGGQKNFLKQQIHDIRKRKYAKNHKINLLTIWYDEIDNIPQILEQYLNNLKLKCVETVIPI